MSLSPADRKKLKDAFMESVKNERPRDNEVAEIGGKTYTGKQIAEEILNQTPLGKRLTSSFVSGIELLISSGNMSLDKVIDDLKTPKPKTLK